MSLQDLRAQLSEADFLASINEEYTDLPSKIALNWLKNGTNVAVLTTILTVVGPSLNILALDRGHLLDPPSVREDALTQNDIDDLTSLLALAPNITAFELGFAGYPPDGVSYAPLLKTYATNLSDAGDDEAATPLVYDETFARTIGNLTSFSGTGMIDFALPVILESLDGGKLTELALGDTVFPSVEELDDLASRTGNLQRLYLAANVDEDAARRLMEANEKLRSVTVRALGVDRRT